MKTLAKGLILGLIVSLFGLASPALAATPNLSATYQQSGFVQLVVTNGNPFSQINLSYRQSSSLWTTVNNIGQTDYNGYFTQSAQIQSDGTNSPLQLYVTVAGLQSSGVSVYPGGGNSGGCTYNCGGPSYGYLSLSQTSINVNAGQSSSVTVYGSGNYYIQSNSNPSAATATISGSTVNITGTNSGDTRISICQNTGSCATLFVSVTGYNCGNYGCGGTLSLSQTSLSLNRGQNSTVTVYNYGGGTLNIYENSNSSVASASISGSGVVINALTAGNTNIRVCANSGQCGTIYVTVSGVLGSTTIAVSMTDNVYTPRVITVPVGATIVWTNNGSMVHTVTADDNSFNSGNIYAGSTYTRTFYAAGTYTYHCVFHGTSGGSGMAGTIIVTNSGGGSSSPVWFSQNSFNLNANQATSATIYSNNYSGSYFLSSNSNNSIVSANVIGNTLNISALSNTGSSTLTVCQSNGINCGTVYVNVTGQGGCGTYGCGGSQVSLSQSSLNLSQGQSASINIYGNGSYYINSNSNPSVASATVSGSTLSIYAGASGNTTIAICQNSPSSCANLTVSVAGGPNYGVLTFTSTTLPTMVIGQYYNYQLQVSGGNPTYTYLLTGGNLPAGLSLSPSGIISGVPGNTSPASFTVRVNDNYGRTASSNFTVSGNVLGANLYANGQLIRENGTIYIVYKNSRTGFASASAFTGLGFRFSDVIDAPNSGLLNSGYIVQSQYASHPWGSWIKSGPTVYFLHELGLIPVPDWNTFLSNGGQAHMVVNANHYDFSLPMLSVMSFNDPRLR